MSEPTPFERIGGAAAVRRLVDRFYDRMDARPDCAELRALHPPDLDRSRDKLTWYLTGWLGGPQDYVERFGHPRLRARHMPFAIGTRERDQWVACMLLAMEEAGIAEPMRERLLQSFFKTADFMRNQPG